jgi:hypothetical protein
MSDTNETQTDSTETVTTTPAAPAKPKRQGIDHDVIVKMAEDLGITVDNSLAAYTSAGHAGGVRLNFAKTEDVTKAYLYKATPSADAAALVKLTPEQRKEKRYGTIECEVDFTKDEAEVLTALKLCLGEVKNAPAPAPKPERKPKAPKADAALADQPVETAPSVETAAEEQPTA